MALILDGNGLIQGLDAGGLPSGSVNADTLASTLDLSSKTMTFGNVSASGITFPATQSASGNANTLDDYEEGSWTPVFTGATSAGTYTYFLQAGTYTKIGNIVTVFCDLTNITQSSAGSGQVRVTGLPFVSASGIDSYSGPANLDRFTLGGTYVVAQMSANTQFVRFKEVTSGSNAGTTVEVSARTGDSSDIYFTMTYPV
jgi:hypothetical protein